MSAKRRLLVWFGDSLLTPQEVEAIMAHKSANPAAPKKPRAPRVKREPSELSVAVKSLNLLKRRQAARDKLIARIETLDTEIVDLQNIAAEKMKTVNDLIYGPEPPKED